MTRAAIFDIDGTLIDSVDLHTDAWVEALRHFGFDVPRHEMRRQIGKGGDQLLPQFVPRDVIDRRGAEITAYRSDLFKRTYLPRVKPFGGVPELFRTVKAAGIRIVLASSGKAEEVDVYAEIAGVSGLVDETVSADDVDRSKPHGDIFAAALERVAPITAADAVAVGDTRWDVIAAGKANLSIVGVLCGGVPEAELREAGAVATYADPADILKRFLASPLAPAWRSQT